MGWGGSTDHITLAQPTPQKPELPVLKLPLGKPLLAALPDADGAAAVRFVGSSTKAERWACSGTFDGSARIEVTLLRSRNEESTADKKDKENLHVRGEQRRMKKGEGASEKHEKRGRDDWCSSGVEGSRGEGRGWDKEEGAIEGSELFETSECDKSPHIPGLSAGNVQCWSSQLNTVLQNSSPLVVDTVLLKASNNWRIITLNWERVKDR